MKKTYQKPNLREIKMETVSIIAGSAVDTPNTVGFQQLSNSGTKIYITSSTDPTEIGWK